MAAYGSRKITAEDRARLIADSDFGAEIDTGHQVQQGKQDGTVEQYKTFHKRGGDTTIRPVDDQGQLKLNRDPIYTNGKVDQAEITPSTINGQPNPEYLSPEDQKNMHEDTQRAVSNYVEATGEPKQAWMRTDGYTDEIEETYDDFKTTKNDEILAGQVAQNNNQNENRMWTAYTNYASNVWSGVTDIVGTAYDLTGRGRGQAQVITDQTKAAMLNGEDAMFKRIVKYPMDMATNQDHFFIQCYAYQPPYQEAMSGKAGAGLGQPGKQRDSGLAFGAKRSSPYQKKLGAGIKLPMPNNMMDTNPRNWKEDTMNLKTIGAIQQSGKNAIGSFLTGDMFGFGPAMRKLSQKIDIATQSSGRTDMMAQQVSQLAADQGVDVSPEDILQRSTGVIANSNTELLFSGVSIRSFEFQWRMSPRDPLEAHNVRMIIRALKQWSAPRKLKKISSGIFDNTGKSGTGQAGGPSYFLGTPNIFRIRYVTSGNKNILGVNKFKACALTNISINYTPDSQWMAYEGGMPISVNMSLSFQELEPIYNTDYSPDVMKERKYDPNDSESLGDLMPISLIKQYDTSTSDVGY